ncbi:MAG: acetylxylan esterase [Niabella sp.]
MAEQRENSHLGSMARFKPAICLIILVLHVTLSARPVYGQEVEDVLPKWAYLNDAHTALYKYFAGQAFEILDRRRSMLLKYDTPQAWLQRQKEVKGAYNEIIGSFPEKTPLKPVITGVLERDGTRVEKLYFESLPGYYVTAALFLPVNRNGRLPAIVYCSGHSKSGFRSRPYQLMILNLVKKGFAVLAFDPIGQGERRQYMDNELFKSFGPTQEHSYPGSQHFLLGRSPAYYFIWDGIRAVDYLYTRDDIDTTRIGITGRSGGGTQAAYIAAFDQRIKAAAPECYITSSEKLLMTRGPQDAEQNFTGSIAKGLDMGDLLLCIAPRPLLMATTTRDIFSIQGARDVFKEVRQAYSFLGKADEIKMVEDDAEHASTLKNREAIYSFFQRYLILPGDSKEAAVTTFLDSELNATAHGNVYSALTSRNLHALALPHLKEVLQKRPAIGGFDDLISRVVKVTGFKNMQPAGTPVFSGRYHRKGYVAESYLLKSITGNYIPVYRLRPLNDKKTINTVLYLDDNGKKEAIKEGGLADSLALRGYEIIAPDLSGFGELATGYIKGGDSWVDKTPLNLWYTGILLDQPLLRVRMQELSFLIDWVSQGHSKIGAFSQGVLSTDLLHIAIMRSKNFSSVILSDPLVSYQSVIEEANYKTRYLLSAAPGMIARYDIGDLINSLSGKVRVLIAKPRNGAGEIINLANHKVSINLKQSVNIVDGITSFRLLDDWYSQSK